MIRTHYSPGNQKPRARARARETDRGDYTRGYTSDDSREIDGRIPAGFRRSSVRTPRPAIASDAGAINAMRRRAGPPSLTPPAAQWPLRSPSSDESGEARVLFSFSFKFSLLSTGADGDASHRFEVVVATALGRLAAQPDRPMACRLLPSAILPLPEHKEAADRAAAETHDRSAAATPAPPPPPPPSPSVLPLPQRGGGSTCVLRLRSFGVLTFDIGVLWQD